MSESRETSVDRPPLARLFGMTFDRLTVRLAVGITLLVVVPLAAGLYLFTQRQYDRGIEARRRAAESENRILEAALRHRMMERDTSLLETILREVSAHSEVRSVMIVDHDGEVRIASESSEVGSQLSEDSPTCLVCHEKDPVKRERWVLLDEPGGGILRAVQPIENRPECHQCHDPSEQYNGMLLLDISLDQLEAQLSRDRAAIVVGAGLVALLLLGGVGLLVRSLILKRLAHVGSAARSIAVGNLSERAPTEGNDVISTLAVDFNNMAGSLSELIAEVQQQEAQLTSVMNSLDDGLVVLDRDGRIVACNQSFSRRVGKSPEALQTQRCHDAIAGALPCCQEGQECPVSRCMTTGEVQRATFRVASATDETKRVEEVYSSPVLDGRSEVVQVVEVWRDITDRVKEEERLAEIERLVSLGTLASGFSHEVNTPLASILMSAESVIGRIDDARDEAAADLLPSIRESADIVRQQVLRCRKTTEQFLRFSRGIPPSIDPIDLGKHVAEVVSLTRPTARESKVDLRFQVPEGNPSVRANAELVQHVVLNVLINAIQSCGTEGGTVEVSLGIDREGTCVRIRDTGSGIRSQDCRHLFEPFRSRKPQGTGLGLFLSRTFMRRFGGDIRLVDTEPGVGSCFEIVFQEVTENA